MGKLSVAIHLVSICTIFKIGIKPDPYLAQSNQPELAAGNGRSHLGVSLHT
jgi:hypothetical protein